MPRSNKFIPTEQQLNKIKEMSDAGFSMEKIGKHPEVNITKKILDRIYKEYGFKKKRKYIEKLDITQDKLIEIKKLRDIGHTRREIWEKLNITEAYVRNAFKILEIPKVKSPTTELTPEFLEKVKKSFEDGKGSRTIAKELDVDRSVVKRAYRELNLQTQIIRENVIKSHRISKTYLEPTKKCNKCGHNKDIIYFQPKYNKNGNVNYGHCKKCNNNASKIRKENDPQFKLKGLVSGSIYKALRAVGSSKNNESCIKYLDFSIKELKKHLESQFEPWMNWQNNSIYKTGTWDDNDASTWVWNLDHIKPISHHTFLSMEDIEFKECWSLGNLRPISAKKNISEQHHRTLEEIEKIKQEIKENYLKLKIMHKLLYQ